MKIRELLKLKECEPLKDDVWIMSRKKYKGMKRQKEENLNGERLYTLYESMCNMDNCEDELLNAEVKNYEWRRSSTFSNRMILLIDL